VPLPVGYLVFVAVATTAYLVLIKVAKRRGPNRAMG
jgi:hypothetical protein